MLLGRLKNLAPEPLGSRVFSTLRRDGSEQHLWRVAVRVRLLLLYGAAYPNYPTFQRLEDFVWCRVSFINKRNILRTFPETPSQNSLPLPSGNPTCTTIEPLR